MQPECCHISFLVTCPCLQHSMSLTLFPPLKSTYSNEREEVSAYRKRKTYTTQQKAGKLCMMDSLTIVLFRSRYHFPSASLIKFASSKNLQKKELQGENFHIRFAFSKHAKEISLNLVHYAMIQAHKILRPYLDTDLTLEVIAFTIHYLILFRMNNV
jgi:hypothetical protein